MVKAAHYFFPILLWLFGASIVHANDSPPNRLVQQQQELRTFLNAPISLIDFKKKKASSNSGVMNGDKCFFRPAENGFCQWYGLFPTPHGISESRRLKGLRLTVYSFNEKPADFTNNNEVLIAIESAFSDPDLGDANLVGEAAGDIHQRFGEPKFISENLLIYHHARHAMSIHFTGNRVDWYKFVHLDCELDPMNIPAWLKSF